MTINYNCPKCFGSGFVMEGNRYDGYARKKCPLCNSQPVVALELAGTTRPSWDSIWMNLAKEIAKRSTCMVPNRHVGCVIVSFDNEHVLSNGCNGGAHGDDNKCDYNGSNNTVVGTSRCTCVHAEMNALAKLDTTNLIKKKMYITFSPCKLCAKLIKNSRIDKVIYDKIYDEEVIKYLNDLGVETEKYESSKNK